jgi:hypothetical protein
VASLALLSASGDPGEIICRVNIYGVCRNYFDAVNLAIDSLPQVPEEDKAVLENLAFRWASKDEQPEIRKKLWLKIVMGFKHDEAKVKAILSRPMCPIKIPDVLTLFDEDQNISGYKEVGSLADRELPQLIRQSHRRLQQEADCLPEGLGLPQAGEQQPG